MLHFSKHSPFVIFTQQTNFYPSNFFTFCYIETKNLNIFIGVLCEKATQSGA